MESTLSRDLYTNDYSQKILSNEIILTLEHQTLKPSPLSAKKTKIPLKIIVDLVNSSLHKNTLEEPPSFRQNFYNNISAINQKIDRHNRRIETSLIVKILKIFTWIFCCRKFKEVHLDRIPRIQYYPENLKVIECSRPNEKPVDRDSIVENLEKPCSIGNNSPLTPCGKIALQLKTGGLLGRKIPKELLSWRTPNDQAIPLDENELILTFMIYDLADGVKSIFPSFSFYLPAKLFEDKKEGDVIELKHRINNKWQLLSFKIDQSTVYKGRFVNSENKKREKKCEHDDSSFRFEDCLKTTCKELHKDLDAGLLGLSKCLFGNKKPYEGYTTQHNAKLFVYNFTQEENHSNHLFVPQDISLFRKKNPSFSEAEWSFSRQKTSPNWKIVFAVPGICKQDRVDIVINQMYFCLYTEKPLKLPPGYKSIGPTFSNYNYLTIIPWKRFFDELDQAQLMDQLNRSKVDLKDGLLTIQYISD